MLYLTVGRLGKEQFSKACHATISNRVVNAFKTGRSGLVGVMVRPSKLYRCDLIEGIHDTLVAAGSLPVMHFSSTSGEATPEAGLLRPSLSNVRSSS
jgi:hypothetical protein